MGAPPDTGRASPFVVGALWIAAVGAAALAGVIGRPDDVTMRAGAVPFLLLFTLPAVALACATIRTRAMLLATAVVSGGWSCATAFLVMRDTSSTAAIGVVTTPFVALVIAAVGVIVDHGWRVVEVARRGRHASR